MGHISRGRSWKAWKVVLFSHAVQFRASALCRFDRIECAERLIRTLEYMTCEKRLKEYLLLSLTDTRPIGYNTGLKMWERLLPKGRNNLFLLSYAKKIRSLF